MRIGDVNDDYNDDDNNDHKRDDNEQCSYLKKLHDYGDASILQNHYVTIKINYMHSPRSNSNKAKENLTCNCPLLLWSCVCTYFRQADMIAGWTVLHVTALERAIWHNRGPLYGKYLSARTNSQ